MKFVDILGLKFNNVTLDEAVGFAMQKADANEKIYVVTPNSEIAHLSLEDNELFNIINNADLVLPDGIGIVYAGKILKTPVKEKVAGVDFAKELVKSMAEKNMSLFILGAKPDVAKTALDNLCKDNSGLVFAGVKDGYFTDDDDAIDAINKTSPDVLFVCLGAPKQEKFIYNNLDKINAKIICGLGGSVDVFAGTVNRAPDFFVNHGLEWFYRLLKQPSRAMRMARLPLFGLAVLKHKNKN